MKTQPTCSSRVRAALSLVFALVLAMALPVAHAAPPEFMTYQGFLVDANGDPLAPSTPANYPVIFRIFTASSGGTRLWSEQQVVTVDKGNFSVILGEGTPVGGEARPSLSSVLAGPNNADRYMSISVTIGATTAEIFPRLRLLPAPYAFTATSASSVVQPNGTPVLSYANSRVEVTGNLFASGTISGNGSGLTGLTAAQIPNVDASKITSGTLPDARLSANVALLADNNTFVGNQTINGTLAMSGGLSFANVVGNKISLHGSIAGAHYGFGIQGNLLQIHTDQLASDIAFSYGTSAATETMRIKGNGNVGIGTNNPTAKLEVNGAAKIDGTLEADSCVVRRDLYTTNLVAFGNTIIFGNASTVGAVLAGVGAPGSKGFGFYNDSDTGMFSSSSGQLGFYSDGIERIRLASNGRVGIGTTAPNAPLEVRASVSYQLTNTQGGSIDTLDANGHNGAAGNTFTQPFSILADQWIGAYGFAARSDRRIKTDITTSPKDKDLSTLLQLRVADYQLIDFANGGPSRRKGLIAQEVEKIIPAAVSRRKEFIPDIFVFATNAAYVPATKTLVLSLNQTHDLKVGDQVRLQLDGRGLDLNVCQVPSTHEFVVNDCESAPRDKVFVYGRQVNDFRSVDYDAVFTTGIGAIQELAGRVQALESENKRIAQLEKEAADTALKHKQEMSELQQELAGLKEVVQQMAAASKPARTAAAR